MMHGLRAAAAESRSRSSSRSSGLVPQFLTRDLLQLGFSLLPFPPFSLTAFAFARRRAQSNAIQELYGYGLMWR